MKLKKAVALRISELLREKNMSCYSLSIKSSLTKQAISNILNKK